MDSYQFSFDDSKRELSITINESKFDAVRVRPFKEQLEGFWEKNVQFVTIDLAAVDFIDSSGIGALLSIKKGLKQLSQPISIINAQSNVVEVIELLRLQRVFSIHSL